MADSTKPRNSKPTATVPIELPGGGKVLVASEPQPLPTFERGEDGVNRANRNKIRTNKEGKELYGFSVLGPEVMQFGRPTLAPIEVIVACQPGKPPVLEVGKSVRLVGATGRVSVINAESVEPMGNAHAAQ